MNIAMEGRPAQPAQKFVIVVKDLIVQAHAQAGSFHQLHDRKAVLIKRCLWHAETVWAVLARMQPGVSQLGFKYWTGRFAWLKAIIISLMMNQHVDPVWSQSLLSTLAASNFSRGNRAASAVASQPSS